MKTFLPEPNDPGCLGCEVGVVALAVILTLTYIGWRRVRSV